MKSINLVNKECRLLRKKYVHACFVQHATEDRVKHQAKCNFMFNHIFVDCERYSIKSLHLHSPDVWRPSAWMKLLGFM